MSIKAGRWGVLKWQVSKKCPELSKTILFLRAACAHESRVTHVRNKVQGREMGWVMMSSAGKVRQKRRKELVIIIIKNEKWNTMKRIDEKRRL